MTKKLKSIGRTIFINLIFLIIFFLIIAFLGEIYLRLVSKISTEKVSAVGLKIFQSSPELGYEHKPLSHDINGYGNPTPEIFINELGLRDKQPKAIIGKKNILLLGDSFTFGTGLNYQDTFAGQLAQKLNPEFQIHNAGTIGYTLDNYFLSLKKLYPKIKPDIVIVNIFVGNDITEFRRHQWQSEKNQLSSIKDTEIEVSQEGSLISVKNREPASYFFHWLNEKLSILSLKGGLIKNAKNSDYTLTWPVFLAENHPGYDPRLSEFWQQFEESIKLIEEFGKQNSIQTFFVIIPMDAQVSKHYWSKYPLIPQLFDQEAFEAKRPQNKIMEICKNQNLSCLDLLPLFQNNKDRDQLYFQNSDPHFDHLGHQLAAELIYQFINP